MSLGKEFESYAATDCIDEWANYDLVTWAEPQRSKSSIDKIGRRLLQGQDDCTESLIVLNDWRTAHAFPLDSIHSELRSLGKTLNKDVLTSHRLKRVSSIKGKLQRSKMRLSRMQDIGGCRAIMPSIEEVYLLQKAMKDNQRRSDCIREIDYIKAPKQSGYKGIHMIYKFQGKKHSGHDSLLIEVQIRSAIQHAWATSVEIAGTFLGSSLKSGDGPSEWLDFFSLVSTLFAAQEGYIPSHLNSDEIQEIKQKVISLRDSLSIIENLKAFSVAVRECNRISSVDGYFVLELKRIEKVVVVWHFLATHLREATSHYVKLEERSTEDDDINIVLVSTESMETLRKTYPNYFADSEKFINILEKCLSL